MNTSRKKQCAIGFRFLFLMVLLSACTNQIPSKNQGIDFSMANNMHTRDSVLPTNLNLEFTSMVRSIFEDSRGNFWFGSDLEGVCCFDGESFTYFTTNDGLCHNQIRTIQEDEHGQMWFATGNGLSSYNHGKFTTHTVKPLQAVAHNRVEWTKEENDLWFNGEFDGGIYRYNGEEVMVLAFPELDPNHISFSIKGTVTGICEGMDNKVWIANYGGVIGYDGTTFTFINERGVDYHVRSILEDSKGNLWIGNNGIGVLRYDGETTIKLSDIKELNGTYKGDFPLHVFGLAEDNNGNIWIGDRDTGVWCYNGNTLKNYTTENGLTNHFVRVIYKDKAGVLWFGLEGGGVCTFNGVSFDKMYEYQK